MKPSTSVLKTQIGPICVTMYEIWYGGGYDIVARNGQVLKHTHANYYPSAQARYNDMVALYTAEYASAQDTMYRYICGVV